jgi:hypothetical protein
MFFTRFDPLFSSSFLTFALTSVVNTAFQLFPLKLICNSRGRDRMVVGFTTTCAISVYHH